MNPMSVLTYISYLPNFIQGFLVYRILSHFARQREGKLWNAVVYLSVTILANIIIFPNDLFNVTLDLIWFILLMLAAFRGSVWQRLAAVAVLYPLVISQNFLVLDMLGYLCERFGRTEAVELACTFADPLLHLLIWYGIYRYFEKYLGQTEQLFDDRIWILLDGVCLASLVSVTTCIYCTPERTWQMWPAAFACFAANLGCIALAEYFITSVRQNMERKNLMLQKSYYEELEQNQAEIRRFRHDMNNHLGVIQSLFLSGSKEEAAQYMKELETQMAVRTRVFCKNSIVNAVLNAKYNLMADYKIYSFFHIDLDKLTGIDAISLCCLFSNTLDNAIEASLKIPDAGRRHVSVKARVAENGYFTYEISNVKNNRVTERKGRPISDKEDGAAHGLGLSNVREMVEKYHGTMEISYTEDRFTVTVLIGDA